ncbi:hypothetical protein SAMN05216242_1455 [Thauera chlorobenzoica]|uniref:hypothetical protein n=1 Tax=Thauera chlorobenzoica TaxID=96773 RepID=UPI0008A07E96|nr:hypothetical protein [Thauera chlorobenzoica]SEG33067.1 hypothetical protein SAMN05216242_1455 [Thauera chlorobenzoica]
MLSRIAGSITPFHRLMPLQKKLNLHGLERKDDPAVRRALEHTRVQPRREVAVNRLHVAADAAGRLSNGYRTGLA